MVGTYETYQSIPGHSIGMGSLLGSGSPFPISPWFLPPEAKARDPKRNKIVKVSTKAFFIIIPHSNVNPDLINMKCASALGVSLLRIIIWIAQ